MPYPAFSGGSLAVWLFKLKSQPHDKSSGQVRIPEVDDRPIVARSEHAFGTKTGADEESSGLAEQPVVVGQHADSRVVERAAIHHAAARDERAVMRVAAAQA